MNHSKQIFKNLAKKYNTPKKVQNLLKKIAYNKSETLLSAAEVWRKKKAHCMEASFFAAAILEHCGYPPLTMSFESKDGLDHVIFIFQKNGKWGAVGHSRDHGLHGRAPVFKSLRALAYSYYDPYIDDSGMLTAYQKISLNDCGADWRYSKRNVWKAEKYYLELPHIKMPSSKKRYLRLRDRHRKHGPLKSGPHWW